MYLATLCPSWRDDLRLLDATPVPVRHLPADGPPQRAVRLGELRLLRRVLALVLGLKLYLLTAPEGMPVAWCLADPKLGARDVAPDLLHHARDLGALRDQMIVLADKGLAGRDMERYAAEQVHVLLARPDRKDERRRFGNLAGMRQWIEAIIGTSKTSSTWDDMGDAPRLASAPGSPSDCRPWPAPSGTTGGPEPRTSAP
jgi:hypothetical protein